MCACTDNAGIGGSRSSCGIVQPSAGMHRSAIRDNGIDVGESIARFDATRLKASDVLQKGPLAVFYRVYWSVQIEPEAIESARISRVLTFRHLRIPGNAWPDGLKAPSIALSHRRHNPDSRIDTGRADRTISGPMRAPSLDHS